jgi:hypothetical protein
VASRSPAEEDGRQLSRHRRRAGRKLLGYKARGNTAYGDRLGDSAPERERQPAKPQATTQKPRTDHARGPTAEQQKPRTDHARGPTGEQQKVLAALCRERGIKYLAPKTAAQAEAQIRRLLVERGDDRGLALDRQCGPTGQQQKELAALCRQRGASYPFPKTAAEAAAQIARLPGH